MVFWFAYSFEWDGTLGVLEYFYWDGVLDVFCIWDGVFVT